MRREWMCSCGAWVPYEYGRHPHVKTRDQSLSEMIAARMGNEPEQLYGASEISYEWRTADHAVRELPDG